MTEAKGALAEPKGRFQILGKWHFGPKVDWQVHKFPHKVVVKERHPVKIDTGQPREERHQFTVWAVDPDVVYYTIGSEKGDYTDFDDLLKRCPTCVANLGKEPVLVSDSYPDNLKSYAPVNSYVVTEGEINTHPKIGQIFRWKAQ